MWKLSPQNILKFLCYLRQKNYPRKNVPMNQTIILVANTDWYLYNFRKNLIIELLDQGNSVTVVCPTGEYVPLLNLLGCTHVPWEVDRKLVSPVREWFFFKKLKQIYQELQPNIVHHHTMKPVLYGSLAARKLKMPVINSIAGRGYIYSSNTIPALFLKAIMNILLRYALKLDQQRIIFENGEDLEYFVQKGLVNRRQTKLIRSVGVDLSRFVPSEPQMAAEFKVGYVGRMLWTKGVGTFMEAAIMLRKIHPNIQMILIGSPDPGNPESIPENKIREWVTEGLIEWWGFQDNMPEVYSQIHVLAFPTHYAEGVPTVLIEAAASERALIASKTPGCQEVIEDEVNGLLISPNNPTELTEKIIFLAEHHDQYHKIRKNARQKIEEHFTYQKVNAATIEVYHDLFLNGTRIAG